MPNVDNKLQLLTCFDEAFFHYHHQRLAHDLFLGDEMDRLKWIDEQAPFALLAHDTNTDPRFIYVNASAMRVFGYSEDEFIGMPSRQSARFDAQADRDIMLASVSKTGYASGYSGVRVRKDGSLFRIERGELWCFDDSEGKPAGQAALVWAVDI